MPEENWSRLPLSKRRGLCTSRYVESLYDTFHLKEFTQVSVNCAWISPILDSVSTLQIRISLNFYKSVIFSIRNYKAE